MAQFCFLGFVKAGQPQEHVWASWEISEPRRQNSPFGGKVSLPLLTPVSWRFALSQPTTQLETREGWVWWQSVAGPPGGLGALAWGPNSHSGERLAPRRGRSHGGRPPVQHADVQAFLQVLLEEVVHLQEAGLLAGAVAGRRGHLEGLPG